MGDYLSNYFQTTANRPIRDDLKHAVREVGGHKVAVDCGCGSGADIEYLRQQGFVVHAFDIDDEAVSISRDRFASDGNVILYQSSFEQFDFPENSLTVADSSLFFCRPEAFPIVWQRIEYALAKGGVFCGSFLGREDDMLQPDSEERGRWGHTLSFEERELRELFDGFDVLSFQEIQHRGEIRPGELHRWHLYCVVARKL
jgi:SAM-dependent methyltransferase